METLALPKSKRDLSAAITTARASAWSERNRYLVMCQFAYYYLRGYRHFMLSSLDDARLLVGFETKLGELRFRNEDLRRKFKTALGLFMRMDVSPLVKRRKWGLDSLSQASVGQVVLDKATSTCNLDDIKMQWFQFLLLYGTAGLGHWAYSKADGRPAHELEVIPPWELLPMPAKPASAADVKAYMRCRWVPLAWLEKKVRPDKDSEGLALPSKSDKAYATKLQIQEVGYGVIPSSLDQHGSGGGIGLSGEDFSTAHTPRDPAVRSEDDSKKQVEKYVPLTEMWVCGPDRSLGRYAVQVGTHVASDINFTEDGVVAPVPIGMGYFVPDTGFYSYGLVGMLMSGNHNVEKMLQNLIQNVEEFNIYGTILWPHTAGAGMKEFTRKNGRPKIVSFEPDWTVPNVQPSTLRPYNSGDLPGRVVASVSEFQDRIADQGPMMSGQPVGRMDSGSGVGFMFEVSQIANAAVGHQTANAYSQVYRSILYTERAMRQPNEAIEVTNIDDNIAGVSLNKEGKLQLDANPIPDPSDVLIDIKDRQPKSKDVRKQEVIGLYQMQLIDDFDVSLINYREDLGLPIDDRQRLEAYRKAMYHNIVLFNDGKSPGDIMPDIVMDNPMVHLRALSAFTARLEFSLASPQVKNKFAEATRLLQSMVGQYPSQLPAMEQMALEMARSSPAPQGGGGAAPQGFGPQGGGLGA